MELCFSLELNLLKEFQPDFASQLPCFCVLEFAKTPRRSCPGGVVCSQILPKLHSALCSFCLMLLLSYWQFFLPCFSQLTLVHSSISGKLFLGMESHLRGRLKGRLQLCCSAMKLEPRLGSYTKAGISQASWHPTSHTYSHCISHTRIWGFLLWGGRRRALPGQDLQVCPG